MKLKASIIHALVALAALAPALQAQVTIPESVALPSTSLDTKKPGFKVRVHQATNKGGVLANSTARTESQIAGLLNDPATGQPFVNIANTAGFNTDGTYSEVGFIGYASGTFPGLPGSEGHQDNVALEAITFIDLRPGTYTMVVNSDDGFRVTTGNVWDRLEELFLGEFEGGRGATDSIFKFTVTKAGVYPFRLIWENGAGQLNVDWYFADNSDPAQRTHINEAGGTPSFAELTTNPLTKPAVNAISPLNGQQGVQPSQPFVIKLLNGSAGVNQTTLKVLRDDTDVTKEAKISSAGDTITVEHTAAKLPDPLATVRYKLTYQDTGTPPTAREVNTSFKVGSYANYNLPPPVWIETFTSPAEGAVPAGWRIESPLPPSGFEDLDDPNSDSYLNFVVISKERVSNLGAIGRWDAARRLNTPEAYINGVRLTSLIDGKFLYGESDVRGGSQVQWAYSPEINLTGKKSIYLVFHNVYEQNQDSLAGVEYSINGGTSWLPALYMIDAADIINKADGTIDAEATLTAPRTDTAIFTDPVTGVENTPDRNYGSFILAQRETWKDLGPYISGRVNDDPFESKRIEKIRLEKADGQAKVSFRLAHAGTGSWYFGVDNFGVYEIISIDPPQVTRPPADASRLVGASVTFDVGVTGEQLTYQWQKNQANITGATSASYTISAVGTADAANYRVIVSNPAGNATSAEAKLTVLAVPSDASSLKNGLAVYLQFENDLKDSSGNNKNGTAVGAPTFATGKVGKGAVKVSSVRSTSTYNFVTLGSNADLPFGQSKPFTVAYWAKTERVAGDPSVVANKNWGSGNNTGWTIGTQSDGRLELNYRRTGADGLSRKDLDAAGAGLAANEWKHVVVVWNIDGEVVSYVNGIELKTPAGGSTRVNLGSSAGDLVDPALSLNLGQDGTGAYTDGEWDGLLDDVAIWDRTLTAEEVLTAYGYGLFGDSILAPPITSGLGSHLKFDGDLADSSGNSVTGTAVGAPTYVAGRVGQAAHLTTDKPANSFNYVTLGTGDKAKFGETQDFSVSFWAKLESYTADPAFISNKDWGSGGNTGWVIATDSDGRVQWNYRREGQTRKDFDSVGSLVNDKNWHHVAVVFGINGQAITYIDGLEVAKDRSGNPARKDITPGTGSLLAAGMALNIGQDGTGKYSDVDQFDGLIDDVGIWNRQISSREVAVIYSNGVSGKALDGSSGGTVPTRPTIAYTVAGGQMTLTWQGDGFALEQTGALVAAATWGPVPGAGANSATVSTSSGTTFYRLKK